MSRIQSMCVAIAMTVAMLPIASRVQAQTQVQTPLTTPAPLLQPEVHAQSQPQYETVARPPVMPQPAAVPETRVGDSTTTWLATQRDGRIAAPAQPMLGVEADAAYRRYLKSFDHPIPAQLNSSVGEVSGGSGTGAQN
jgi:hypothetical protein